MCLYDTELSLDSFRVSGVRDERELIPAGGRCGTRSTPGEIVEDLGGFQLCQAFYFVETVEDRVPMTIGFSSREN